MRLAHSWRVSFGPSIVNGTSRTVLKRKMMLMGKATVLASREVTCAARNSRVISGSTLEYTVNRTVVAATIGDVGWKP
jgi:hypothetical protein